MANFRHCNFSQRTNPWKMKVLRLRTGSVLSFEVEKPPHPAPWIYGDSDVPWNSKCSTDNSWHYISMSNVSAREYFAAAGVLFNIENWTRVRDSFYSLVPLPFSHFGHLLLLLHVQTISESGSVLFSAAYGDHIEKSNAHCFCFFPYFCLIFPFHPSKECLHHFILVRKQWKVSLIVSQSPRWPSGMSVYVIQTHQNAKRFSFFMWCKTEKGWCERLGPENVWTSCFVSSSCNYWVF